MIFLEVAGMSIAWNWTNWFFLLFNSHPLFPHLWNLDPKLAIPSIGHSSFKVYVYVYVYKE